LGAFFFCGGGAIAEPEKDEDADERLSTALNYFVGDFFAGVIDCATNRNYQAPSLM
jgi:hypothetical protein